MNIFYINGYSLGEYKGDKYKVLSSALNENIILAEYKYDENNISEIEDKVKDADIIIASSTGAYLARNICYKHNIPLISLNPVINLKETFDKMGVNTPNIEDGGDKVLRELILVTEDDELIDPIKTIEKYKNQTVIVPGGTHRFENVETAVPYIKNFIKMLFT